MNTPVAIITLPNPPVHAAVKDSFSEHGKAIGKLHDWATNLTRQLQQTLSTMRTQLNTQVQGVGTALTSGATVAPSAPIHHITGSGTITQIDAPAGFSGPVFLVSDNGFTLATGGNIAAGTAAITAGKSLLAVYDPSSAKWYPHVGS